MILPYSLIMAFTLIFCLSYYKKAKKPKIYENPDPSKKPLGFKDFIRWSLSSKRKAWPKQILVANDAPPPYADDHQLRVSFVGHATFLLQLDNLNILTDPVWSERASPISFLGPKRVSQPGIDFTNLPKIDVILVSHNHYDHLDISTLAKLAKRDQPLIIAPLGNEKVIVSCADKVKIVCLDWSEQYKFSDKLTVCLEPAQHWSARGFWDKNKALWGTFVLKTSKGDICFIGDSGYSKEIFKAIGQKYQIYLGLIPIGAYEPRWFMKNVHMNPDEAVQTFQDLGATYGLASHFATFPLADDGFDQPINEFKVALEKHQINEQNFILPRIGKAYKF